MIENLNDLQGDIIFIKNIDNIVPDRLRNQTSYWKKALGGYLLTIQNHIFKSLRKTSIRLKTAPLKPRDVTSLTSLTGP